MLISWKNITVKSDLNDHLSVSFYTFCKLLFSIISHKTFCSVPFSDIFANLHSQFDFIKVQEGQFLGSDQTRCGTQQGGRATAVSFIIYKIHGEKQMALLYLHSFKPMEHQMTSRVRDAKMYTGQMFPALKHRVWRCQTALSDGS